MRWTLKYRHLVMSYRQPGTILTDRTFLVPLDHGNPEGDRIEIYAREVVTIDKADAGLPWLLFLQGGPGHAANRPVGREAWLDRALRDYRVLLLDQRGTGRSSLVNRQTLAALGSAKAQADYLANFRADSIVLDAELIRRELIDDEPWSVLGQSFGGFCTVTYLSFAPHGLREAFLTGGLPGLGTTADDVYRLTYAKVAKKNAAYYAKYPDDVEHVRRIAEYLADHSVTMPDGYPLTVEAFQAVGITLGHGTGSHQMHYLVERAFTPDGEISDTFRYQMAAKLSYSAAPMYAVLHEACYCQDGGPTNWSAQRIRAEFPEFDAAKALEGDDPVLFTGEMVYPWTVDGDPTLRPLRDAAEILASKDDWPPLYDPARLSANEVPAAAAIYYDDMYVPSEFSIPTAGAIKGLRPWITNEYEHDGLRVSNGRVLDRLIALVRGNL
jgi:pimeloyl-ACP methyl ester carboxylesterase